MYFQVGGTYTKPIILPPQVAIGALGKIQVMNRINYLLRIIKIMSITGESFRHFLSSVTEHLWNGGGVI